MRGKNRGKIILLLLIFIVIILLNPKVTKNIRVRIMQSEYKIELIKEIEVPYNASIFYQKLDNGMIKYWDGTLLYYDYNGEQKWSKHLGAINPIVKTNDNHIYFVDINKSKLIKINKKGNIQYEYTFKDKFFNLWICEDDHVLIQYDTKSPLNHLEIIDNNSKKIATIMLGEGEVINVSISNENNIIVINTLKIQNNLIESYLLFYDIYGNLSGSQNLDDDLALNFMYDRNGNLIVFKEAEIFCTNKNKEILWRIPTYTTKRIGIVPKTYTVVYGGNIEKNRIIYTGADEKLRLIDIQGKVIKEILINEELIGIDCHRVRFGAHSLRTIYIFDKRGNLQIQHPYSSDIDGIFVLTQNNFAITTREKIVFIRIKN